MELGSPKHDKKLVCKICECQVNCRTFNSHSNSCRDRAEIREKILRYQSRISAHINKAYDLRNQLNTNFAIEKKKLGKTLLKKNDSTPENTLQIPASPEMNTDQVANQEDNSGMYLTVDMEGSMMKRSQKKSKTTCHVLSPLGYNKNDYEDETLRSLQVLKMIIQYGQNSLTNIHEADPDLINDFKVKNQVNLLYVEIKDKQISEYINEFLQLIQKLIKYKGLLTKKQEDIARIEEELYSPGASDVELLSPQLKSKMSYNSQISHKSSKITSLDDGNINERVFKKPSLHLKDLKETFSRGGSARILSHREHRSSNTPLLPRKEQFTPKASAGLSKFAANAFFKDFPLEVSGSGSALLKRTNTMRRKGKIAADLLKDIEKIGHIKFRHEMATAGLADSSSPEKVKFDLKDDKEGGSKDDIEDNDNEEQKDGHALRRVFTFNVNKIEEKKKNLKEYINEEHEGYEGETEGKDGEEIEDNEDKEETVKQKKEKGHKRVGSWDYKPKKVNLKKLLEGSAKAIDLELLEEGLFLQGPVKASFSTMDNMNLSKMLSQKRKKAAHDAMEEIEEEHESLSLFTIRGYYSDSEVNQVRKLDLQNNNEMSIEDFDFIKMLGEGAYGKVYLVRKKTTGDLYAMKIIDYADKENKNNKTKSLRAERDVYKLIQGDWVVKAYYTFNHQSYICFVQEYIIGGDLQHLLEQMGCFEESVAKFYFAELLLAVESLHELGIVHRDLKPNNVMIDATGHIKLTDFGLSEVGLERLRMNASTIRSLLTRENSLMDQNSSPQSREEALAKIERTNSTYFQRADSISQEGNDPAGTLDSIPRQDSGLDLMMMSMSIRQNKPQTEEFSLSKNKPDEQTVFPFLATQEERSNWKKGDNPMGISQMNQSLRRKEKRRIVGTPDYIAPEIIRGEDCNDKAIDLWSLGVILYEFMVGIPPFNDETIDKIFGNILHMRMEWPDIGYDEDCLSPEAADLMKKLMNPNPKERIKIKDVKRHPFFKGFDWQSMKQMTVPIVPKKKEIDDNVPLMDLSTIFKPNDFKLMKRNSIIQEIPTFNTKRYDLLHQLNQSLYRNHMMENSDDFFELKTQETQQMRNSISTLFPSK